VTIPTSVSSAFTPIIMILHEKTLTPTCDRERAHYQEPTPKDVNNHMRMYVSSCGSVLQCAAGLVQCATACCHVRRVCCSDLKRVVVCVAVSFSVSPCGAVCCNAVQFVSVCCIVLQCVADCVAACCRVCCRVF